MVGFGGPFEGGGEFELVDFVVVVDEDLGFVDGVGVVVLGGELMSVPVWFVSMSITSRR